MEPHITGLLNAMMMVKFIFKTSSRVSIPHAEMVEPHLISTFGMNGPP
jgi:hypothetical protein